MMLLFLDDIENERKLMQVISERLDYFWFSVLLVGRLDPMLVENSVWTAVSIGIGF
jgi:hypothetical protein